MLRNVKVQQTIATRQKALAEKRVGDVDRLVDEAGTNLSKARLLRQMGSANGALEFIGKATGLVDGRQHQAPGQHVTQIVINLTPGVVPPDQPQVIELTPPSVEGEFREVPEGDES